MRTTILLVLGLALVAGFSAAQYHPSLYILGGYATTTTTYWNGFWLADTQNQTTKHLTPSNLMYQSYCVQMDADNKNIVASVIGTTGTTYAAYLQSGIYRIDPATNTVTTVMAHPDTLYQPRRLLINQDGDYVVQCYQRTQVSPTSVYAYNFLKVTAGSTITTILDSTKLGTTSLTTYGLGRNMDTGHYLFNVYFSPTYYYSVLDVDDNGVFTTFGGGPSPAYGWYGYYANMEQDLDTGHIVGMYSRVIYQLRKGDPTRTTLYNIGYPGGLTVYTYGSNFDLQTAPSKRLIGSRYFTSSNPTIYDPAVVFIDMSTPGYPVTAVNTDPLHNLHNAGLTLYKYPYAQSLYQNRNIQTIKVAPKKWDVRFSCPSYPLKAYVAVISMAGYRPAVPLPDGRRIYLFPDGWTQLALLGLLRPFFDAGPQRLDANGEAQGSMDFSLLPPLDIPIWIAMAVLDPSAPSGIAFLPEPYVFRIP